ncbi:MAG: DUF2927 domain-containing protein [Paracoccaceae bacterium]
MSQTTPVLTPKARPPAPVAAPAVATAPSIDSAALRVYYQRILNDGLTQGLLRADGGGVDTPYTAAMLMRNFEDIAFFSEYQRGGQPLRRWVVPIRMETRFGPSVSAANTTRDRNAVTAYAARLSRITGHPITITKERANFHVFFASEDDRPGFINQIKTLEPRIDAGTLATILNLPRETYCLVVAFTPVGQPGTYTRAIALIRAEQPDLMRLSCIHEELAQGLGLANDSPAARPSIFNDDDEFALLTSHDEALLKLLYDPRLSPGISADEARPVLRILTREVMGEDV